MVQIHGMNREIEEITGAKASFFVRREEKMMALEVAFKIHSDIHKMIHGMWESYAETQAVIRERINEDYRIATRNFDERNADLRESIQLDFATLSAATLCMNNGSQFDLRG